GSGKFRGGLGQVISVGTRSDKPFRFPTMFDREKNPANGLAGGNPGAKAETLLNNDSIIKSKRLYHLNPEDIITMKLTGVGGYGDPKRGKLDSVLQDVVEGYVSKETAKEK